MLNELYKNIYVSVVNGVSSEWTLANNKNNELANMVFGGVVDIPSQFAKRYYSNNHTALKAFLQRKVNGLNLSDRVWNYTNGFKKEIELAIEYGLRDGLSAHEMTKELRQYLRHPNKLFRRVRDEDGILRLSKAAKEFHPGQGVYRSSYKNALRLASNEINIAYRTADHLRWQQMDFVVGIEIRLSNNHTLNGVPFYDICDVLCGKYPKDFVFKGFHVNCRCHAVAILKTKAEIMADNKLILAGKEPTKISKNTIYKPPKNLKKWKKDNAQRISKWKNKPYFMVDNPSYFS